MLLQLLVILVLLQLVPPCVSEKCCGYANSACCRTVPLATLSYNATECTVSATFNAYSPSLSCRGFNQCYVMYWPNSTVCNAATSYLVPTPTTNVMFSCGRTYTCPDRRLASLGGVDPTWFAGGATVWYSTYCEDSSAHAPCANNGIAPGGGWSTCQSIVMPGLTCLMSRLVQQVNTSRSSCDFNVSLTVSPSLTDASGSANTCSVQIYNASSNAAVLHQSQVMCSPASGGCPVYQMTSTLVNLSSTPSFSQSASYYAVVTCEYPTSMNRFISGIVKLRPCQNTPTLLWPGPYSSSTALLWRTAGTSNTIPVGLYTANGVTVNWYMPGGPSSPWQLRIVSSLYSSANSIFEWPYYGNFSAYSSATGGGYALYPSYGELNAFLSESCQFQIINPAYSTSVPVFSTPPVSTANGCFLQLQNDGNFIIKDSITQGLWVSGTNFATGNQVSRWSSWTGDALINTPSKAVAFSLDNVGRMGLYTPGRVGVGNNVSIVTSLPRRGLPPSGAPASWSVSKLFGANSFPKWTDYFRNLNGAMCPLLVPVSLTLNSYCDVVLTSTCYNQSVSWSSNSWNYLYARNGTNASSYQPCQMMLAPDGWLGVQSTGSPLQHAWKKASWMLTYGDNLTTGYDSVYTHTALISPVGCYMLYLDTIDYNVKLWQSCGDPAVLWQTKYPGVRSSAMWIKPSKCKLLMNAISATGSVVSMLSPAPTYSDHYCFLNVTDQGEVNLVDFFTSAVVWSLGTYKSSHLVDVSTQLCLAAVPYDAVLSPVSAVWRVPCVTGAVSQLWQRSSMSGTSTLMNLANQLCLNATGGFTNCTTGGAFISWKLNFQSSQQLVAFVDGSCLTSSGAGSSTVLSAPCLGAGLCSNGQCASQQRWGDDMSSSGTTSTIQISDPGTNNSNPQCVGVPGAHAAAADAYPFFDACDPQDADQQWYVYGSSLRSFASELCWDTGLDPAYHTTFMNKCNASSLTQQWFFNATDSGTTWQLVSIYWSLPVIMAAESAVINYWGGLYQFGSGYVEVTTVPLTLA